MPIFTQPSKSQISDLCYYASQEGFDYSDCITVEDCRARAEENEALGSYCIPHCPEMNLKDHATLADFFNAFKPGSVFFE